MRYRRSLLHKDLDQQLGDRTLGAVPFGVAENPLAAEVRQYIVELVRRQVAPILSPPFRLSRLRSLSIPLHDFQDLDGFDTACARSRQPCREQRCG